MPLVLNASCEIQHFKVFGNHFTLKPGQIKNFTDEIAKFCGYQRRDQGLIELPAEFEEQDYMNSPHGQERLLKLKAEGVKNRVLALRAVVYNNQVSLRQDLEKANIKIDPRILASDGEVSAMEELAKYQDQGDDAAQKKLERIKELEKKIATR